MARLTIIVMCLLATTMSLGVDGRLFLPGVMNYFACDTQHKIVPGDTCKSISDKYEIKISLLKWKNKKLDCNKLEIGQRLCVDNWV